MSRTVRALCALALAAAALGAVAYSGEPSWEARSVGTVTAGSQGEPSWESAAPDTAWGGNLPPDTSWGGAVSVGVIVGEPSWELSPESARA
ncbi:hypothetical protein ACWEFL_24745 [Streptomyces sp. NPDC004838]